MDASQQPICLRIHGDNIIECERGLHLIANSFSAKIQHLVSAPYMPEYEILDNRIVLFHVTLLPGHKRWGTNIQTIFQSHGSLLRETTDVIITKVSKDKIYEEILLAVEFSAALPAGNNAWQRNGRALACALVGIPYLYFTEVGGIELDKNRKPKAPRFPNPIVPFSYLTITETYGVLCLPVYTPSPSSSENIYTQFSPATGTEDVKDVIRYAIENKLTPQPYEILVQKTIAMVNILTDIRKRAATLHGDEWMDFLKLDTGRKKADWLAQKQINWQKKRASKIETTETFQKLIRLFESIHPVSIGASDIPVCLIPQNERPNFAQKVLDLYGNSINPQFIKWLNVNSPLIIVWITGFKPKGDDSRPDRGLVPLARMLFGEQVDILSIVSGPAKVEMWAMLQKDSEQLIRQNGLWEAIICLSNAVLVDSPTLPHRPITLLLTPFHKQNQNRIHFPITPATINFSEHDVDSIVHLLFSTNMDAGVFEAMCNPPGGDWSGLSIINFKTGEEFRWTSLPRISGVGSKRPDHVIQFNSPEEKITLLAIESKNMPSKLLPNLGTNLTAYIRKLSETPPTAIKATNSDWQLWQNGGFPMSEINIISGGAFCWTQEDALALYLDRCQLDIVLAIEFDLVEQSALLHIMVRPMANFLLPKIHYLAQRFGGRLKIQVH